MPEPGTGLWPKDSPSVYLNALVDRYKGLNASIARYHYYLKSGLDETTVFNLIKADKVVSLDQMEEIINERGQVLEDEIKAQNPEIDAQGLIDEVRALLSQEFGAEQ